MDGKEKAGAWAAAQVSEGMMVGLGTGSTAGYFVRHLAQRVRDTGLKIRLTSSSISTTLLAEELGLSIMPMDQVGHLDLYGDGADEVDGRKRLLKGRGAAMVREKILAEMADRFLVFIDPSKQVTRLGTLFPVPVEVLFSARTLVARKLASLGGQAVLRTGSGKDGPVITDEGNLVFDVRFPAERDASELEILLDSFPGVVGHGLFTRLGDRITVVVGGPEGVSILA